MDKIKTHNFYNKNLKSNSRELRKHGTLSEIIMWTQVLKARKLKGYQFHRQRPILIYIADFFCKELNLIIELDGNTHEYKKEEDKIRQNNLEDRGYTLIRFPDNEVSDNLDEVKRILENWIDEYEKEHPEIKKYSIRKRTSPLPP